MGIGKNNRKPPYSCERQTDNITTDTQEGYEKRLGNSYSEESGTKIDNANACPQGANL